MSKIDKAFVVLLMALAAIAIYIQYLEKEELQMYIQEQKQIIDESYARDSAFTEENNRLQARLSNYVSESGCGITLNGKEVSTSELVKLLNSTIMENDSLTQVLESYKEFEMESQKVNKSNIKLLRAYADSTQMMNILKNKLREKYGMGIDAYIKGDRIFFTIEASKVDSALWLFPYVKDKLTTDPKTGTTYIDYHRNSEKKVDPVQTEEKSFWQRLFRR